MKSRKQLKIIMGLILLTCSSKVFAQTGSDSIVDTFFQKYELEGPTKSLDYLFSLNPWMKTNKEQISSVQNALNASIKLIGSYSGYELITKKSIGQNFVLYSYMIRYSRQPIRFTLIFYRPNKEWVFYNFKFDDSLSSELEEAAKAKFLPENLSGNKK